MHMTDMMDMLDASEIIDNPGRDSYVQYGQRRISYREFLHKYGENSLSRDILAFLKVDEIVRPQAGRLLVVRDDRVYFSAGDEEIINKASNMDLDYLFDCGVSFCEVEKRLCLDYSKIEFSSALET
jgi:hypothetical protein